MSCPAEIPAGVQMLDRECDYARCQGVIFSNQRMSRNWQEILNSRFWGKFLPFC